ncbi:hypothetical protein ACIRFH_13980 [Streptomyces sp. NPDC093586]|uniref:hypothetical protein n=1 Tax=Streptomyces sp. NPDC093586 TaxID=3366042 RepID=UPI0037F352C6
MHARDNARQPGTENSRAPVRASARPGGRPPRSLLDLQGSAGNAAVARMVRRDGARGPEAARPHRTGPGAAPVIQRAQDPEKKSFEAFEQKIRQATVRQGATPATLSPLISGFLAGTGPEERAERLKKARRLIDGLPDHFPEESVNAAHAALDQHDHTRPALAVPGAHYVSASHVTDPIGNGYINRDIPGVVVIEKQPYVPVYSAVYADALIDPAPKNKDIGQDEHGLVQIHTGDPSPGEKVLWVSIGQPLRQLKWVDKYRIHGKAGNPMIRSFLVPLHIANAISRGAVTEHNSGGGRTEDLNVDKHFASNQFGIRDPGSLEQLRQYALPGSLRTYTDGDTQGNPDSWGDVRRTGELREKLGVPETNLANFPVFTEKSGEFLSHAKYAGKTSKLRRIAAAHTGNPSLLEKGDKPVTQSYVKEFFWKNAPQELKDQARPQGTLNRAGERAAIDTFVRKLVIPWATQARIAEEIHQGFDEFTQSNPGKTPVDYRLTDEPGTLRGERRKAAVDLGADQRELMKSRWTILQGFKALDLSGAGAFKEAAGIKGAPQVLGQLRQQRETVLADYQFKIGDRNTLLAKNREYAEAASGLHAELSAILPQDLNRLPALRAILTGLATIASGS